MDLLLLSDGKKYHYVSFKDLGKVVDFIRHHDPRTRNKICRNCFQVCFSNEALQNHLEVCNDKETAVITMPHQDSDKVVFKRHEAHWFAPYVIYFDLESLTQPVESCHPDPTKSISTVLEKHKPCGYSIALVEHGKHRVKSFHLERGPEVMKGFINNLEILAREIHAQTRTNMVYIGHPDVNKFKVAKCWFCQQKFKNDDVKVWTTAMRVEHFSDSPTISVTSREKQLTSLPLLVTMLATTTSTTLFKP